MELSKFKKLYKVYTKLPLPKEIWTTKGYDEFVEAMNEDINCREWYLKQKIGGAGIKYQSYCCLEMAYRLIEDRKIGREINYDCVITYSRSQKSFGLPVHDGGASFISIKFCPWCAKELSKFPINSRK